MTVLSKMTEIWKDIDGFPRYKVSNLGRVKSYCLKQERILTPRPKNGYKTIVLAGREKLIHRLMLKAFIPNPNPDIFTICDHINRNSMDNRLENLRWSTTQLNNLNRTCRGYYYDKRDNKFIAQLSINGKQKHLGSFKYSIHARQCYVAAKHKLLKEIDQYHDY
jgi:hypothetical protein